VYQYIGIINTNERDSSRKTYFPHDVALYDEGRGQIVAANLTGMGRKNHTQIYCQDITWIAVALDEIGWQIFASRVMKILLL